MFLRQYKIKNFLIFLNFCIKYIKLLTNKVRIYYFEWNNYFKFIN